MAATPPAFGGFTPVKREKPQHVSCLSTLFVFHQTPKRMACYHPLLAWRSQTGRNDNGSWPLVFNIKHGHPDLQIKIPCGQCIGCRLEYSRRWAIRLMHEHQLHEATSFLTLTYSPEHLPKNNSLTKGQDGDMTLFLKRLRHHLPNSAKIRYFQCGEYGSLLQRPHHHVCLFGWDFPDKTRYGSSGDHTTYKSEMLDRIWQKGSCLIGKVTFESAAYVARYIIDKKTGEPGKEAYDLQNRIPPYVTMSRNPGIAAKWIHKYQADVYPEDELVIRKGFKCKPPRFYDLQIDEETLRVVKARRIKEAENQTDNSLDRLSVKETVKLAQISQFARNLEISTLHLQK